MHAAGRLLAARSVEPAATWLGGDVGLVDSDVRQDLAWTGCTWPTSASATSTWILSTNHSVRKLTQTPTDEIINGTFDWVYEEELSLRDGFRWSPDSRSIAFWKIDTEGVSQVPLVNNTDSLYPKVTWIPYPKVGQRNSSCRDWSR